MRERERKLREMTKEGGPHTRLASRDSKRNSAALSAKEQAFLDGLLELFEELSNEKSELLAKNKVSKGSPKTPPLSKPKPTPPGKTGNLPASQVVPNRPESPPQEQLTHQANTTAKEQPIGGKVTSPNPGLVQHPTHSQLPRMNPQVQPPNSQVKYAQSVRSYFDRKYAEIYTSRGDFPFTNPEATDRACCTPIKIAYWAHRQTPGACEDPTVPARRHLLQWAQAQQEAGREVRFL